MSWPAQPFYGTPKLDRRFELVKIAFEKTLASEMMARLTSPEVAEVARRLADAMLAEMDKDNEKGSDDG